MSVYLGYDTITKQYLKSLAGAGSGSDELNDYFKELFDECKKYILPNDRPKEDGKHRPSFSIKCRTHSLCAAVLWKKVKSLYPMTITEFSKKCSISKPTIINTTCSLCMNN